MALGDSFYRKASEKIQSQIGEPVEVLGWASRTGAMGSVIAGKVVGGASVAMGGSNSSYMGIPGDRMQVAGDDKGVKLPINFMVVLTPSALRVFKISNGWSGVKIKGELGTMPRQGLQLGIEDAKVTKQFELAGTDGSAIRFEMTKSKFATKFADELEAALSLS
ncbi:MAG TPA: hypothetical protein VH817_15700 [Thermoleophilaceae bacterium]